ncbi:hypothetical protein RKE25_23140 (plasmid) [Dyella sp. BiH032]|uniref:hypothetical protein n=1 Tax=Dyella sp. BiH032 TaxID=3075430 RepID=UPI0028931042|nr:hypothetical protein [Dyella sp. BiH032]WNL48580.1 hypothetical protein RKE25_23140 [Dyella sp. BiH032]
MSKVTPEKKQQARRAGYRAALRQESWVATDCATFRMLIDGFAPGEGAIELAQDWMDGYQERRNEEAATNVGGLQHV